MFLNQYLTIEFYYDLSKFKTIVKINKMFYSYQLKANFYCNIKTHTI